MVQSNLKNTAFPADGGWLEANSNRSDTSLSQAELLDFLQRSLAGEPFPVSGHRATPEPPLPLSSRIREILRANENNAPAAVEPEDTDRHQAMDEPSLVEPAPTPDEEDLGSHLLAPVGFVPTPTEPARRPIVSWGSAVFVLALTTSSALIPTMLATPPEYAAQSRLQFLGAGRTTPGFMDAAILRLTSQHALAQTVTRLKLDHDAEFSGGKATAFSVVRDILTDTGAASDNFSRAQLALQQRLIVVPDLQAGTVSLVARSEDPAKSARIANMLADIAVHDAAARPISAAPAGVSLEVENDRKRFDAATAALANFKAAAGDAKIAAATDLMTRRETLGHQLATATSAAQAASIRLTAARSVKMADVLDGAISPDLGSPVALEDLRNRYAAARSMMGQLSTQLGPRHPRLLAVQSTIDTLGASILAELRKIVVASDAEARRTATDVKQLKDRMTELDRQTVDVDLAAFRQLQDTVETARQTYEASLAASEQVAPRRTTTEVPVALISPAVPAASPIDDNMTWLTFRSALAGFAAALALVAGRLLVGRSRRGSPAEQHGIDFATVDLLADFPKETAPVRPPLDQPQKRFDAGVAVANDRQALAEPAPVQQETALSAIIGDVASLRERVATYASQRQAAGR